MKKIIFAALFGATALSPLPSLASDFGCKVLLCLADPRGPTTESECKPPIEKLYRDLSKGKPFPTCDMATNSQTGQKSYARQGYNYFDDCPEGTTAQKEGVLTARAGQRTYSKASLMRGIGTGEGKSFANDEDGFGFNSTKLCVAGYAGTRRVSHGDEEYSYQIYQTVIALGRASSPRYIDVYINDKVFRRVRW